MPISNLFSLKGELAVITGGAGILGKEHAVALLEAGAKVILFDINEKSLNKTVSSFSKKYPGKIFGMTLDVTSEEMIKERMEEVWKKHGPITILLNNVAHNPPPNKFATDRLENFTLENWNTYVAVGLTSAFLMSKVVGSKMAKRKKGVIVNVASDLGLIAPDQRIYRIPGLPKDQQPAKAVTYSVIKHGIIGLTKYLATYWAEDGIRVNSISPGGVQKDQSPEFVKKVTELIPMGRMAKRDEYRASIVFLCSQASKYMTGSNLIIDGGRTCW